MLNVHLVALVYLRIISRFFLSFFIISRMISYALLVCLNLTDVFFSATTYG